ARVGDVLRSEPGGVERSPRQQRIEWRLWVVDDERADSGVVVSGADSHRLHPKRVDVGIAEPDPDVRIGARRFDLRYRIARHVERRLAEDDAAMSPDADPERVDAPVAARPSHPAEHRRLVAGRAEERRRRRAVLLRAKLEGRAIP